jgi:hypothetical protein
MARYAVMPIGHSLCLVDLEPTDPSPLAAYLFGFFRCLIVSRVPRALIDSPGGEWWAAELSRMAVKLNAMEEQT